MKSYLQKARSLKTAIDCKQEHIAQLCALAEKNKRCFGAANSGDTAAACIERFKKEIEQDILQLIATQRDIQKMINGLQHQHLRTILELYYLGGHTWETVAEKTHYSARRVHDLHNIALQKLRAGCAQASA